MDIPRITKQLKSLAPGFPITKASLPGTLDQEKKKGNIGASFNTSWSRRYPARLARAIILDNLVKPLTKVVASPDIFGEDRLEGLEAPVIFASNHASHLDTPIILSMLPDKFKHRCVVGAGADYFFDRRWKAYLWSGTLGAIPIERMRVSRDSAETATQLLSDKWNLLIFPEGGRTPDGLGQSFKGGVAQLAIKVGAPIVPIYLEGTFELLGKTSSRMKMGKTRITFGKPIHPDATSDARTLTKQLESEIAHLATEAHSDYWTAQIERYKDPAKNFEPIDRSSWIAEWERSATVPKKEEKPPWPKYFGSSKKRRVDG